MTFARKDNFYRFWCNPANEGWQYRSACQRRVEEIIGGSVQHIEMYPSCKDAIEHGRCPAMIMTDEEMDKGETIYYVDRDDAGPGVVRRDKPREQKTIERHHQILARLKIKANASVTNVTQRNSKEATVTPPAPTKAYNAFEDFDLATLINKDVAELKGAA